MTIFLFVAVLGLIFSIITHFGVLFGVLELSTLLMVVLNIGMLILCGFICVNSMRLSQRFDKKIRKKALANACPRWMWAIAAFFFLYALAILAYFCIAGHFVASHISFLELTGNKINKGLTSVHVAGYAIAIPMYYYYKYLKKMDT